MFAATVCNAQTVLWDGEDKEVGSDGGFWNRAEPTVEHCNAGLPLGDVDFKGLRRMTMRIKMSINHNVLVKLVKDGDGGYSTGRLFWCGDADQWNILTFEFAAGPDNEKISDTGNTVLEIWPFEDGGDALANVGQTIYIDDVKMEGPMVDGKGILALPDNSLTGEVTVTGVIGKGNYQCTWDGDWHPEAYDDYALLAAKLAPTATKLDVSGAGRWDEDWDVIKAKCPGIEIITETSTGIQQTNMYQDATNETYTLTGVRVATPTEKGIYIVGGRKVLVK